MGVRFVVWIMIGIVGVAPANPIFVAIGNEDVEALRQAVQANPDAVNRVVNVSGSATRLTTPLHHAVGTGRLALVDVLVEAGATIDIENEDAMTPLFFAARLGYLDVVRRLLDAGADPNHPSRSIHGTMALDHAASGGHVKVVRLLLGKGAAVNGERALERAISNDHWETVDLLLDRGADPNRSYAMVGAAARAPLRILTRMVDRGGDANTTQFYGGTLSRAAGSLEKVKFLVSRGADVNGSFKNGDRPLHGAAWTGNVEVARFLIAQGATVDAKKADGQRPIEVAIRFRHPSMIRALLAAGAVPSIHAHVALGQDTEVRRILEVSPSQRDAPLAGDDAMRPIIVAVRSRETRALQILLEAGADANTNYHGSSALHLAVETFDQRALEMVGLLLDRGANPDAKLPNDLYVSPGVTPLHEVATRLSAEGEIPTTVEGGHPGIQLLRLLLERGADLDATSVRDGTPREILEESNHPLLQRMAKPD